MGNQIEYVVQTGGRRFNAILDKQTQADTASLDKYNREGVFWEGRLPNSPLILAADLSSNIATLIKLPIKYSWLDDANSSVVKSIEEWEASFKAILPGISIIRVDEFLRQQWSIGRNDNWLQDIDQVNDLIESVKRQSKAHWKQIQ